jgi:SpoIIAA-like
MTLDHREKHETGAGLHWVEHGVVISEVKNGGQIDLAEARRITTVFQELNGDVCRPLLVDFGKIKSQTKEARDYFAKDPTHIRTYSAVAIVVNNTLAKLIANFFMGLNKPLRPTRLFNDRESALAWLDQFRAES